MIEQGLFALAISIMVVLLGGIIVAVLAIRNIKSRSANGGK